MGNSERGSRFLRGCCLVRPAIHTLRPSPMWGGSLPWRIMAKEPHRPSKPMRDIKNRGAALWIVQLSEHSQVVLDHALGRELLYPLSRAFSASMTTNIIKAAVASPRCPVNKTLSRVLARQLCTVHSGRASQAIIQI